MRADNRGEGGVLALMALVSRQEGDHPAPPPHLPDDRRGGRRAVLRRLPADARHLGAERRRGPQGRDTGAAAAGGADRARRAGGAVRRPAFRHRRRRPLVRADHAALVHRAVRAGRAPDRRGAAGPDGVPAASRLRIRPASRLRHLPRPGRGDARGDRRGGALCRHGPFRPRAHPPRLAVAGAAGAARQLLRPGRAAAERRRARSRTRSSASRRTGRSIRWWRSPPPPR